MAKKKRGWKPDFTITSVWLAEDYREGLIDIGWQTKTAGFGHLSFKNVDGKIHCGNETMGKKFITSVLLKLVEVAILDE